MIDALPLIVPPRATRASKSSASGCLLAASGFRLPASGFRLPALLMANWQRVTNSGAKGWLRKQVSGSWQWMRECCCGGPSCGHCSSGTPETMSVAITDYTPACASYPGSLGQFIAQFKLTGGLASSFTKTLGQGYYGSIPSYSPAANNPCAWWVALTDLTFGFWLEPAVCDTDPPSYSYTGATAWLVVTRDANGYSVQIIYDNGTTNGVVYASWYLSSNTTPCIATVSGGSAPAISIDPQ